MALFGLHTPIFGPLHPIIGKLSGSTGLEGFTQYLLAFGNATGGLTQDAGLYTNAAGDFGFKAGLYRNSVLWLNYNDSYPYNVYFGPLVGNITGTGQGNSAIGYNTLKAITSGQNNLAWGRNTMLALTQGDGNVGLGTSCLTAITTGSANLAIGQGAMESTSATGVGNNVAIGYIALKNVQSSSNVAIGYSAGSALTSGNETVAIGADALKTCSTSARNTAVGFNCLPLTTGNRNTAVGDQAGSVNTTGTQNTYIGALAGSTGTTNSITNAIALGHNTQVTASNTGRIGTGVSIGIDCQPTVKFSVLEKSGMTDIGGFAIRLTNKTGANSVKGTLVKAATATDEAVILSVANDNECIGIVYTDGVADGSEIWVVVSGIAEVKLENNAAATRGYWVDASPTAGRAAMVTPAPGAVAGHFEEIGHCIQSVAASASGCLAKCVIHFN